MIASSDASTNSRKGMLSFSFQSLALAYDFDVRDSAVDSARTIQCSSAEDQLRNRCLRLCDDVHRGFYTRRASLAGSRINRQRGEEDGLRYVEDSLCEVRDESMTALQMESALIFPHWIDHGAQSSLG